MKDYKKLIFAYFLGVLTFIFIGMSFNQDIHRPSGMGIVELEIGCDDYYEFGILNEEAFDSIVLRINVNCDVGTTNRL